MYGADGVCININIYIHINIHSLPRSLFPHHCQPTTTAITKPGKKGCEILCSVSLLCVFVLIYNISRHLFITWRWLVIFNIHELSILTRRQQQQQKNDVLFCAWWNGILKNSRKKGHSLAVLAIFTFSAIKWQWSVYP